MDLSGCSLASIQIRCETKVQGHESANELIVDRRTTEEFSWRVKALG